MSESKSRTEGPESGEPCRWLWGSGIVIAMIIVLVAAIFALNQREDRDMFGFTNRAPDGVTITFEEQTAQWDEMIATIKAKTTALSPGILWDGYGEEEWRLSYACDDDTEGATGRTFVVGTTEDWPQYRDLVEELKKVFSSIATDYGFSLGDGVGEHSFVAPYPPQPETYLDIKVNSYGLLFHVQQGCLTSGVSGSE